MLNSLARLSTNSRFLPNRSSLLRNERLTGLSGLVVSRSPIVQHSRQQQPGASPSPVQLVATTRYFSSRQKEIVNVYYPSTLYDEQVDSPIIHLVDEDKKFHRNQELQHVLARIDRSKYFVVQVVPGNAKENVPPTCRLTSKDDIIEAAKAKVQKKKKANTSKQIQLNWAIDLKDLEHRLGRMKEFLAEGREVEVMLAVKKRGKRASPIEAQAVVKRVDEAAASVPGAQESRTREGTIGRVLKLFYRGDKVQQ